MARFDRVFLAIAAALVLLSSAAFAVQQNGNPGKDNNVLSRDNVLRDPEIPSSETRRAT